MEQSLLIPIELEPFTFTEEQSDYAALGLQPKASSIEFVRQFARDFRPV